MKKKMLSLSVIFIILFCADSSADEGMWMPPFIKQKIFSKMQDNGFDLSADDIYSTDHTSMKDAVVIFGGFCTGALVSDQGLILTNHHCGYETIQCHSSVNNNYLKKGFWAHTKDQEIPSPDLYVKFLKDIKDVTDSVLLNVTPEMSPEQRENEIDSVIKTIESNASNENQFITASVYPFYERNKYFLVVYEKYNDVRFVGAPPVTIGKFGGNTDNWTWPRHTGDFSLFRVYTDPEGNPASYSEDNIPMKPEHYFPVSAQGYEEGDYAMTMGFPGTTYRYITSHGVKQIKNIINQTRIKVREKMLNILDNEMEKSEEIQLKYTSKYASLSNYYKYSVGQNKGIDELNILQRKRDKEKQYMDWASNKVSESYQYDSALYFIKTGMQQRKPYINAFYHLYECFRAGSQILSFIHSFNSSHQLMQYSDLDSLKEALTNFKPRAKEFYKNYNPPTDRKLTKSAMNLYHNSINPKYQPPIYDTINRIFNGNIDRYIDVMFRTSIFTDSSKLYKFLSEPDKSVLKNDLAFKAANSVFTMYDSVLTTYKKKNESVEKGRRLFMDGLMKMQPEKTFYPDANFTMRISYGDVQDYTPRDGILYEHFTTMKGIMEKEDTCKRLFNVPPKLKQLYQNKNFGGYDINGRMPVCFITDNDITGGNSGSPVLNAEGEYIGAAFDGNWEAMTGDLMYEPQLQRCIAVDARYILFIIEKYGEATNLIEDMTIKK